ncbi:MAG TPA: hypothetical protein VMP41_08560 [Acidimicrobiales bacterium]|nr:hypothetical protein [Acidimicrobiales bacterium]
MGQSNQSAAVVDRFLAAVEAGDMPGDVFADDAALDATVPNWRFEARGGDAVRSELASWYADPGQFLDLQRTAIPGGELVEFTLSWTQDGVPHRVHQAHILRVVDDRVSTDTAFCGGRWPADLIAEMEAAAATTTDA